MRIILTLLCFLTVHPAFAQDEAAFDERIELARQMVEINPIENQVKNAIDLYVRNYMPMAPENEQELYRSSMLRVINPDALEQATIDAYAEIFTLQELESMVVYHTKPEARSASAKQGEFNNMIYPEIIRMLDQANMKLRTEPAEPAQ